MEYGKSTTAQTHEPRVMVHEFQSERTTIDEQMQVGI